MLTLNFIFKRFFVSIFLVLGVVVLTFIMVQLAPGDPAAVWAGKPRGPGAAEAIERARQYLGLDLPLYQRLAIHVYRFFTGNWGVSVKFKQPVIELVIRNFAASLELVIYAFAIAVPLSLWLGKKAALNRGSFADRVIYYCSVSLAGAPRFLIAGLLYAVLFVAGYPYLGLRVALQYATYNKITGFITIDTLISGRIDMFIDALLRLIPPVLVLSTYPLGVLARVIRVSLAESFEEEYVRLAISLGMPRSIIVKRYTLPNIVPVVAQLTGLMFSYLILEAMVVENVFAREGLGELISRAIVASDYPLVVGATAFTAVVLIIANTVADVVQALTNPRVQL